jgi:hypothetical protein
MLLAAMNARRNRRRHDGSDKQTNAGTFQIPSSARVARRGSTRVESTPVADVAPRSRGGFRASEG